ncbi:MAG: dipicolinate synthase subunit DpsA [Ruminococcus sp.]
MINKSIVFLGGDKRQLFAANAFAEMGFTVYLSGFDKLESKGDLIITDIYTGIVNSDIIVFPVTGIQDRMIPCYFSNKELKLSDELLELLKNKIVFSGKSQSIKNISKEIKIYDYLDREEFAVANALATAEGAVQVAMEEYEGLISNSRCLVTGYGRIGRILSSMLNSLNAKVTVSTEKTDHFEYIIATGNKPIKTNKITGLNNYDIVFNTVPALIIDKKVLENSSPNVLIIDLASLPGGVDFKTAKKLNISAIHALSLPGKCSPKAAGEIITKTILNMLKEEFSWQRQT